MFNAWFFKVVQYPMERAGLASARNGICRRALHRAVEGDSYRRARGRRSGGPVRELFLRQAVPEAGQRAYAEGLLLYHAAEMLPWRNRLAIWTKAVKLLPEPLQARRRTPASAILKVHPRAVWKHCGR